MSNPDVVDFILRLDSGEITDLDELVEGMQGLIDSGLVQSLQGGYQRLATCLVEAGHCQRKEEGT